MKKQYLIVFLFVVIALVFAACAPASSQANEMCGEQDLAVLRPLGEGPVFHISELDILYSHATSMKLSLPREYELVQCGSSWVVLMDLSRGLETTTVGLGQNRVSPGTFNVVFYKQP